MISSKKKKTSFDDEEEEEEREFRTKATIKFLLLLGSFLLIVAAVVLLLAATQKNDNKKNAWNNTNNNNNNNDTTSLIPMSQGWDIDGNIAPFLDASSPTSTPPTVPPSISTTAPPLTDTQEELLTILASVSPTSKEFIRDHRESPQFQALDWLANDVNVDKYSMRRLVQRWVMATFYLSTNGDDWDTATTTTTATTTSNQTTRAGLKGPAGAEEGTAASWMSQTHECEWYTTHNQKIICDGQERLVVLSLGHRNLRGTLPTELGLLTTLKRLYLPDNHIDGSIPTDLALLTKLESIHISSNLITGQIPSELGQLSALGKFGLECHSSYSS
jgi:Leucine-rich repeat (LRR) protein